MGAWAADSFGNDDAMDWVFDLQKSSGLNIVRSAIAGVPDSGEYIEAPEASVALAAAEVVAALLGRPMAELPDEVSAWVNAHRELVPDDDLVRSVRQTCVRIGDDLESSELAQLWAEAAPDDREAWRAGVRSLRERLG
jgi:uncharacterized protein DUF4259